MNHINWVQQNEDYKVEYHVTKWKTSHFHEPFSHRMVESAKLKPDSAAAPSSLEASQKDSEGIGFGLEKRGGSGKLRPGFGLEEALARELSGAEKGRDGVTISGKSESASEAARGVVQSAALMQAQAAENTVTPVMECDSEIEKAEKAQAEKESTTVLQSGRGNIRNRLRESAARLREAYQRQKEKTAKLRLKQVKKEEKKEKKGTRQAADREAVLSMQAQNHYLLDSYDATGNYSMLGKK